MSFANSSNFTIEGSTFTDVNGDVINYASHPGERGFRVLFKYSCPEAAYDSQYYHPNTGGSSSTRELAVQDVFDWINNGRTKICWIYGAPGTGKSQIVQDIAAQCASRNILGGSFFFNRNFRTSSESLVSSIAYQLAVSNIEKRLQVGEAVENDPAILQKPLAVQMRKLIVAPFLSSTTEDDETPPPRPAGPSIVIVIDGLDECSGEGYQREILHIIREASSHKHLPILWIIASRPETSIRQSFDAITTQVHSISIAEITRLLETRRPRSIFTYFRNRFNESYERRPNATAFIQRAFMNLYDLFCLLFWYIVILFAVIFVFCFLVMLLVRALGSGRPPRHPVTNNTPTAIPSRFIPRI